MNSSDKATWRRAAVWCAFGCVFLLALLFYLSCFVSIASGNK